MGSNGVTASDLEFKRNGNCHELSVQKEYFAKIKDGTKTVEGRAGKIDTENDIHENYRQKETNFKVGHTVKFIISGHSADSESESESESESVACEITRVEFHETFEEMLTKSGLSTCLPGIKSMEEGVRIYRGFSGYQQREELYGVVGIHLRVIR